MTGQQAKGNMSAVDTGGGRSLKQQVLGLLQGSDFESSVRHLCLLPGRKVINPLFSFLLHSDQQIRWRTVVAMAAVIDNLSRTNIEDARVIIRRLMWSLNDESGGIGWGAPEVMGEALARSAKLADEYSSIFCSYADENGNFLEHEGLQQGLLWGWIQIARVRPNVLQHGESLLTKYLDSQNPAVRGLGAMAIGLVGLKNAQQKLQDLLQDASKFLTFTEDHLSEMSVGEAASGALRMLSQDQTKSPDPSRKHPSS